MSDDFAKLFVILWSYSDSSAFGVVPVLFNARDKEMITAVLNELGECNKDWKFVEVRPSWSLSDTMRTET